MTSRADPVEEPLREGLALIAARRWFEAHEVLEVAWRATPLGPERALVQGLIQLAVALEHWRRGNPRGTAGQWAKARRHLEPLPVEVLGVDVPATLARWERCLAENDLHGALAAQARGEPAAGSLAGVAPTVARVARTAATGATLSLP